MALGLFLIGSETSLFSRHFHVYAYFQNLNGLSTETRVNVSGLNAGSVSAIRFPTRLLRVFA